MTSPLDSQFDPHAIEAPLYQWWTERGLFHVPADAPGERYVIQMPPPNVTAVLHAGHGLTYTIQDVLTRFERMRGAKALWLPGTDHAGIATQNVVEKLLAKNGQTRFDIGRKEFEEHVWRFVRETGPVILSQLKALGASCDWSRTYFTLDPALSRAVREVFVRLHEKGLVYRGKYIINWCPRCLTALSNEEVEKEERDGNLWHLKYPLEDGSGFITVATTRPETMLGDTGIAVHPADTRYKKLIGTNVRLPLVDRLIPIVADDAVDAAFGSGAVKVTPAHDPTDFEIGRRHDLETIDVMTDDAHMSDTVPERFRGLDRYVARKRVVAEFEALGLLDRIEKHRSAIGRCYRCDTVVEPKLSDQWFVKMAPLAAPALAAYRDGTLKFIPAYQGDNYATWMENIRDWCISRQLWWGHRIPVWYCDAGIAGSGPAAVTPDAAPVATAATDAPRSGATAASSGNDPREVVDAPTSGASVAAVATGTATGASAAPRGCGNVIVSRDTPDKCDKCGGTLRQDDDVLDTWFSSWLVPFSSLGWPDKTPDLAAFYPGTTMVTAPEILFFWVARMIMAGIEFMGEVPFTTIYLHGTVRDTQHRKMSKSLGNGIDPLEVINRHGADALRYTVVSGMSVGTDLILDPADLDTSFASGRYFANKLWNIGKLLLGHLQEGAAPLAAIDRSRMTLADRWILSRAQDAIAQATQFNEKFQLNEAAGAIYRFLWSDFADWYLEQIKPRLYGNQEGGDVARAVSAHVFDIALRLLHPIMPFITEELWQRLPNHEADASISQAEWPAVVPGDRDPLAHSDFGALQASITGIRNLRAQYNVAPGKTIHVIIERASEPLQRALMTERETLIRLGKVDRLELDVAAPSDAATEVLADGTSVSVPLGDLVDLDKECARLGAEAGKLDELVAAQEKKLSNEQFVSRAPASVIDKEREKLASWRTQAASLREKRQALGCAS